MKNPFPGMNPWLEEHWQDVHAKFLVYACDQLNAELPPGMQARIDERLAIDAEAEKPHTYLPDLAITEPWDRLAKPVLGEGGVAVVTAEPIIVDFGQQVLRHLEIVESRTHVITVTHTREQPATISHLLCQVRMRHSALGEPGAPRPLLQSPRT